MASFYDPEVVKLAEKAGQGTNLTVRLGGKIEPASGDPVDIDVTVLSILDKLYAELLQQSGKPILFRAGDVVALRCGSIDIVVSSERCPCFSPSNVCQGLTESCQIRLDAEEFLSPPRANRNPVIISSKINNAPLSCVSFVTSAVSVRSAEASRRDCGQLGRISIVHDEI